MPKGFSLNTLMLDEARSAPQVVAAQVRGDEALYRDLGARLRDDPPAGAVTIARGSSDHAASYFAYMSAARGGHIVCSLPMSLITLYDAPIVTKGMLAVAISQSGGSPDLHAPMRLFRQGGGTTVALVNDTASVLAQASQWVLPLSAGVERSVAATKTFICSLVAAARLVGAWCDEPELGSAVMALPETLERACEQDWSAGVEALATTQRIMVIGRGTGLAIAQEAALKFKETCGIQAEAFSSAEVQHGPMALVHEGYPMLVFAPRGPAQAGLLTLAGEMRRRGARVLLVAPRDIAQRELTLALSPTEDLDPIAAIQSFYLMVEALARARGLNPDRPPHLNKITATI
jgi:glutamine---fructose-6-phosphate transaminase (isomerizing)